MSVPLTEAERGVINEQIEWLDGVLANPLLDIVHRQRARELWCNLVCTRDEGWDRDD